jgi:homoprotocatechuate degradation regulator HpaR
MNKKALEVGQDDQRLRDGSQPDRKHPLLSGNNRETDGQTAMPDFSHSLPMLLMRSRESVMRLFRPSLRSHDVTEQQWRVLRALAHVGECEVTELAHITFLHAPSLSRILKDLLSRGLIERASGATDRRRGLVTVSQTGRDLIGAVAPLSEAGYARIKKNYGVKRLEELQRMLLDLEKALAQPEVGAEQEKRKL